MEGTPLVESDAELVERMRRQDPGAFDVLFERHREGVRRRLARMLRDEAAADDLVQEVFLRLWTSGHRWRRRGPLAAWLARIATNLALNHLRSVRRRRQRPLDRTPGPQAEADDLPGGEWLADAAALGPDEVLVLAERRERLGRLIAALPEAKRRVVRLVHEAELNVREAAEALGLPEGTVKSRLHYAIKRLAEQWNRTPGAW